MRPDDADADVDELHAGAAGGSSLSCHCELSCLTICSEEEPPTWRGGGGWKCYKLHLVSGQVIGDLLWLDSAGDERRATKVKPAAAEAAGAAGGGSVASVAGDGFACRQ